ncbi:antitoxin [Planctomycetota bacterium]
METAKLFINGRSQAVRLPKQCRFKGKDVYVKKVDGIVMLIPKEGSWDSFAASLDKFSDDFFEEGREQDKPELREEL